MKYLYVTLLNILSVVGASANPQQMLYKCSTLSRMIEAEEGLPHLLLSAITYVESSDMPWVIGVEGATHRYKTKQGALDKIKELKAKGVKNFDIGCMQINHHYHKDKFQSEEKMINPIRNIRFAAKFLKQLKEEAGSWEKAVSYYNSRDLRYSAPYANKVYNQWGKIKSRIALPTFSALVNEAASIFKSTPTKIVDNPALQRAKVAYLTYKKTIIRQ